MTILATDRSGLEEKSPGLSIMLVFEGCQVTLELDSSLGFKKKTELKKKIIENGGIISFIVTKKVVCKFSADQYHR